MSPDPSQVDSIAEPFLRPRLGNEILTTCAEVMAWVLAVPTLVVGLLCPFLYVYVGKFKKLFDNLHADLPASTRFILAEGWWFYTVIPYAVALCLLAMLITSRNAGAKLAFAVMSSLIVASSCGVS